MEDMNSTKEKQLIEDEIISLEEVSLEEFTDKHSFKNWKSFKAVVGVLHILFVIFGIYQTYVLYMSKWGTNSSTGVIQEEFTENYILNSIDFSVNPCTNFYQFACGNWMQYDIPNHMFRASAIAELENKLERRIESYLNRENTSDEPKAVHQARKMYKSCVGPRKQNQADEFFRISRFLQELHLPVVPNFSKKNKQFSWMLTAIESKKLLNHNFFIQFTIQPDPYIITSNRIYITNPSHKFHSNYNKRETLYSKFKSKLYKFVKNIAIYMSEKSNKRWNTMTKLTFHNWFSKLFKFAVRIEELDVSSDASYLAHYTSIDDLQQITDEIFYNRNNCSKIDWKFYLEEMFDGSGIHMDLQPDDRLILTPDINNIFSVLKLLAKTPPHIIEFYMWWRTIFTILPYSNIFLNNKYSEYFAKFFQKQRPPRDLYCVNLVNEAFPYAVSYFIVNDDSVNKKIAKVSEMFTNIKNTFSHEIRHLTWLDETTRMKALRKLDSMKKNIGYPQWMSNMTKVDQYYNKIIMDEVNLLENVITVKKHKFRKMLALYSIQNDHQNENPWIDHIFQVNGFYDSFYNSITIPAGLMWYPFFSLENEAMNYGAIGMIIGHELTHGFDEQGKEFDSEGHLYSWWSYRTKIEYENRAKCFINYNQFINVDDEKFNGQDILLSLNENIADHGGLRIAFKSFKNYTRNYAESKSLNFTAEQLFFLAFAHSRCEHNSPEFLKLKLTDEHGLDVIRVLATLSNSAEFSEAWQCPVGSPMNPDTPKCQLW